MSEGSGFPHWELVLHVMLDHGPRLDGWRLTYTEPRRWSQLVDAASISAPVAHVVIDGPIEHEDLI